MKDILGVGKRPQGTFDAKMLFKETKKVSTSEAGSIIVHVGTGLFKACMILDVLALETESNDEIYDIVIQGCEEEGFTAAKVCDLCSLTLSASEVKRTDSDRDDTAGRYKLYFDNENNGVFYPYLRIYTVVGGSVASDGITYGAYAVPME